MRPSADAAMWQMTRGRRDVEVAMSSGRPDSGPVLLVAHVLHPLDRLAVERLLDGDVRHRRGRRRAVPVLLAGLEPDHVARADLLDRAALALGQARAEGDDERLPQR